ncbi:MAG TPA: YjbQ family protein [Nitrososphaeria archaeon]|nr:YjbQ family protein [Nitrososphaeria archaeon]
MKSSSREFTYSSSAEVELIDVTEDVERAVRESGVRSGICLISVPHATAAVVANEHEEGLLMDIIGLIRKLFPRDGKYLHNRIDDNAHAHLAATIIGSSRSFPVMDGRLVRGTWQNIFLVELDGPRSVRKVVVTVVGDGDGD